MEWTFDRRECGDERDGEMGRVGEKVELLLGLKWNTGVTRAWYDGYLDGEKRLFFQG
jgi:hypothetical protein